MYDEYENERIDYLEYQFLDVMARKIEHENNLYDSIHKSIMESEVQHAQV